MWKKLLVLSAGFVFLTHQAWGVNGMPIELAPSSELSELATQAVGALMIEGKFEDNDKSVKEIEYSRGNVVYIGDSENGSLLLASAFHVMRDGKADPSRLEEMRLMFGPAVSDLRVGKLDRRYWYPSLSNAKIHIYPGYENSKEGTPENTDAIALIEMPNHFAAPRRPVNLVESGAALPHRGLFYTVGMGLDSLEASDPKALYSRYEAQKTSGKLRMSPLRLDFFFSPLLLRLSPYPYKDWEAIHESKFPDDGMVDGPCDFDGGAPLFMEASQLTDLGGERVAKERLALVGAFYGVSNTCIRNHSDKTKEPLISYVNLTKPAIQVWIRKFLK